MDHQCYYCEQGFLSIEDREKHLIDKHSTTKDQMGNHILTPEDHRVKIRIEKKSRAKMSKKMLENKRKRLKTSPKKKYKKVKKKK